MAILTVYHGTNANFSRFEQEKARIANDFYGGGVAYFTDDKNVAATYAKSMYNKNKEGDKFVYQVRLEVSKLFDVDAIFPPKELNKILKNTSEIEEFARGANLLTFNVDKFDIITKVQDETLKLTCDQVFKGLSKGMNQTAKAREKIKTLGYDSLRYNGGVNMGAQRHNVYLTYNSNKITIERRFIIDSENNFLELK